MNGLLVKDVDFCHSMIKAAQDSEGIIWVGVRWVCEGIGFTEGKMKYERKRIQEDSVLSKGGRNFILPTVGGEQEVLCLMLDYLPLWLAKISITPKMQKETPEIADKLIQYQLKAKDVLAAAFLNKSSSVMTENNIDVMSALEAMTKKFDRLYEDMGTMVKLVQSIEERQNKITEKQDQIVATPFRSLEDKEKAGWKELIYSKMNLLVNKHIYGNVSEILSYIYRYMNRNYSIVWEQEKKEYKERNNVSRNPSTIDVIYDNESIKSIFMAILNDLLEKNRISSDETSMGQTLEYTIIEEIIRPLIEKYQDKSNAGMVTYHKVYKYMDTHYRIGWKNLKTRYINRYGNKNVTKKNIILNSPSLMKKFKESVNVLLAE